MENSAPSTSTGRKSVAPAVTCLVSMFPPVLYSGIVAALRRRDPHLARKRPQRDAYPTRLIEPRVGPPRPALRARKRPQLQRGRGELVREQAEAGDERGPAPVCCAHVQHVDAERVAGARVRDVHGAVHLVQACKVEGRERREVRCGRELAVGRVEAVEGDGVPGRDVQDRRDAVRAVGERQTGDRAGTCLLSHARWERLTAWYGAPNDLCGSESV